MLCFLIALHDFEGVSGKKLQVTYALVGQQTKNSPLLRKYEGVMGKGMVLFLVPGAYKTELELEFYDGDN